MSFSAALISASLHLNRLPSCCATTSAVPPQKKIHSASGAKLQVNHFRERGGDGGGRHRKSGAVEVCAVPRLPSLFTGASESHSLPLGCSVDAHRGKERRRPRRSTCGSHLEEAGRAQVRADVARFGATRTSSGGGAEQHAAYGDGFSHAGGACLFDAKRVFAGSTAPAGFFLL